MAEDTKQSSTKAPSARVIDDFIAQSERILDAANGIQQSLEQLTEEITLTALTKHELVDDINMMSNSIKRLWKTYKLLAKVTKQYAE